MLNPSFNELAKRGDSRYTLVMLTAKRARKIIEGAEPLVETSSKKPVSIALQEVIEGEITYTRPPINSIK
ncbi:DNA-directed RNA polymerase subunit omega [Tissierella sp.]|uniref:DNA-directed RNA polymerase subunit omega n=1 Tax=Tissierella sp. TaxID=41274 RepID=UPI0028AE2D5C|nr:DNA-directed RNA polymerase subunit omega [Tissierella sp.]